MPALTDLTVDWVSFVDRAAVRDAVNQSEPARFLVWKSETPSAAQQRVAKSADLLMVKADRQIVYGVVLQPGVTDSQGDVVSPEEIQRAAHRYLVESRKSDVQHNKQQAPAEVVESYIAPSDVAVAGKPVLKGAWVMGVHVTDAGLWERVTKGDLTGFSIGGTAVRKSDPAPAGRPTNQEADMADQNRITRLEVENAELRSRLGEGDEDPAETLTKAMFHLRDTKAMLVEHGTSPTHPSMENVRKAETALQTEYQALMSERARGRGRHGVQKAAGALAEAHAKAAEICKADLRTSPVQALERVMKDDRDLQARYLAEQRSR